MKSWINKKKNNAHIDIFFNKDVKHAIIYAQPQKQKKNKQQQNDEK